MNLIYLVQHPNSIYHIDVDVKHKKLLILLHNVCTQMAPFLLFLRRLFINKKKENKDKFNNFSWDPHESGSNH